MEINRMSKKTLFKEFEGKQIRTVWDESTEEWYFSVVDTVEALTDSANPRNLWFKIKKRITFEDGIQLSPSWRQLKLIAADGKQYNTDCANYHSLLRIIQSITSNKTEHFTQWLANEIGIDNALNISTSPPKIMDYNSLITHIGDVLQQGRSQSAYTVNNILVQTYWQIGQYIVEFEQEGALKAEYGAKLLDQLSKDLTIKYGKGFGRSNLVYIRKLYMSYSIGGTVSHQFKNNQLSAIGGTVSHQFKKPILSTKLCWGHYYEILKADNPLEISFYTKQCEKERWSVRELKRQMKGLLFHRLALSKDKEGILALAQKGTEVQKPEDLLKEPFLFDFLGVPILHQYLEGELEERLIQNLEMLLLELGKGFAFVKRQYRIPIGNRYFSVDLVFYNILLKSYVLIDLKRGEIEHGDIGQMNFYLNYFRKEVNIDTDSEPIGIVLGAYKDRIVVEYALDNITNQLFVSKYQLYLPLKEDLERELERLLENNG